MATPQLDVINLVEGQANAHITVNEAFARFDAFIQLSVKDRDLSTPPGSPAEGDRYLVKATGTGDWTGQDGDVAVFSNAVWIFATPKEGWRIWVDDENITILFDGTVFITLSTAYTLTLFDDTTAAEARTTLGLGTGDDVDFQSVKVGGVEVIDSSRNLTNIASATMTGNLSIDRGATSLTVSFDADAGNLRNLNFLSAGSSRWQIRVNDTAEGGSDAGSDYQLLARDDAGAALFSNAFTIKRSTGQVGIGVAPTSIAAQLDVSQVSSIGAIPVLRLDQTDISEEMIEFNTTVGVGNAIEAVGAKTLTVTHFVKCTVTGVGTRYFALGTIA